MQSVTPPLPSTFCARLVRDLGEAEAAPLCRALNRPEAATVSVRLNPLKAAAVPDGAAPVPWCAGGYRLKERPDFTGDPLLHAGCYYVQEAASMGVALAYEAMAEKPRLLLDLCAAPGGKSTLWRSLMPEGTLLVANEPVRQRAMVLRENLQKWGHPDVMVCMSAPADFARLPGLFDAIATDVPCSGEGMFRKDHNARSEWSEENAAMCAARQRKILSDVWPALREGGYLVYSTCTFNPAENEENVAWACRELGAEIVPLQAPEGVGITEHEGALKFLPHRTIGEGFFLALLRKTAPLATLRLRKVEKCVGLPRGWLQEERHFAGLLQKDGTLCALRATLLPATTAIRAATHTIATGVETAVPKGREWRPAHALALCTSLKPDAFPRAELSRTDALQYLSRQAVTLSPSVPRGHVIACYDGHPLGFLNNLGTRANNLYPAGWRIRRALC